MICDYGCKKLAYFKLKNGKNCCSRRPAGCESLKKINSAKQSKLYKSGKRKSGADNYKNLSQNSKTKMAWSKGVSIVLNEDLFIIGQPANRALIKERILKDNLIECKCEKCGLENLWMNELIILDLDHINGNNLDNRLENLRFLCPNCHSQTSTYKGRNISKSKKKVSDKDLLTAYKNHANVHKALIAVGLVPKGANYQRVKRLIGDL